MSTDKNEFKCVGCGSKMFEIASNPKPDDTITCNGCKAIARYGDVQRSAIEQGKAAVQKALRDSLTKTGFKFN